MAIELLKVIKATILAVLLLLGLLDHRKIIEELGKFIVKDLYESGKPSAKDSSGKSTSPAVKFVRDPPQLKCIVIREKELNEFKELFDGFPNHDNEVNVVSLFGVPGSGKTELARQYGNFAFEKHGVATVITLNAEGTNEFRKDLFKVLKQIKTPKLTMEQIDFMQRWELSELINELRQFLQKRPGWLLIVDNIRDPNIPQKDLYKELPWPRTDQWGSGKMLVTMQVPLHDRNSTHVRIRNTNDGLTLNDATNFLCGLVTRGESSRVCDGKVATDIVIRLERLPLSIFAAGIYIESSMSMKSSGSYSIDNYLAELESLEVPHAHDLKPSQTEYPRSMLAALQLTIEQTIKVNSDQLPADVFLDFIALMGYTAEEGTIPSLHVEKYIKMRGHDQKRFLTLRNFPLVDFWEETKHFRAHQVVRYAFRAALLKRSGMDLLLYTFGNISHYFATVHKSNPADDWEIAKTFLYFVENLPSPYCHLNLCIMPTEENLEDIISLFFKRFDLFLFPSQSFCCVLDTFLIRLCNIRLDNPNRVPPLIIFKGYRILHSCYKEQDEKEMVATRAIDVIKEVAPERSELHTVVASKFLLREISFMLPREQFKDEVFRSLLCSKTLLNMYSKVRDIRQVVDYFKKLCLSLSEFYKLLTPSQYLIEKVRTMLISISKMTYLEVNIEYVAAIMSRCSTFYHNDKVIQDKKLPDDYYIGLGKRYGQNGTKQSDVEKNLYGACKQVYTVREFGPSLTFYLDYDMGIGAKNNEIIFNKYFEVFNYFIRMLQEFKTTLHGLILEENRMKGQGRKMTFELEQFRKEILEQERQCSLVWTKTMGGIAESNYQDKILLFFDYLLRYNFIVDNIHTINEHYVSNHKMSLTTVRRYVNIGAMDLTIRKLLCHQRREGETEILLEVFDETMHAFWPTTD